MATAAFLSALTPVKIALILAVVFFSITAVVYWVGRRLTLSADALGLLCLFVAGYFLFSLAVAPAYAKAAEIFALSEQLSQTTSVQMKDLSIVLGMSSAIFALGIRRGWRKD
mgnify:CR=1 FL=1